MCNVELDLLTIKLCQAKSGVFVGVENCIESWIEHSNLETNYYHESGPTLNVRMCCEDQEERN